MKRAKKNLLKYRRLVWFTGPSGKTVKEFDRLLNLGFTPPPIPTSQGTYRKPRPTTK